MGSEEVASSPETVIISQAFVDASVHLPLGHRIRVLLDQIDQADVLHRPLPVAVVWPRTPHGRWGDRQSTDGRARGPSRPIGDASAMGGISRPFIIDDRSRM